MLDVFITGANRGIGLEFTRQYLARGERVFAALRNPKRGAALHELQTQYGDRLSLIPLEVTDGAQIASAYKMTCSQTEKLDLLINNAGIFHPSNELDEITPDLLSQSFAVNAIAPLQIIQTFADLLAAGENPRIVNITAPVPAIHALKRTQNHMYLASRYALNALTRMIAPELQTRGILAVGLWPGYIRTDMNQMAEGATPPDVALPPVISVIDSIRAEHCGLCLTPDGALYPPPTDD